MRIPHRVSSHAVYKIKNTSAPLFHPATHNLKKLSCKATVATMGNSAIIGDDRMQSY